MKKSVSLNNFLLCFLLCLPLLGPSATVGQVEVMSPVVSSLPSHAPVLNTHNVIDRVYVNALDTMGPTIEAYHYPIHPTSADYIIDYSAIVTDPSGVEKVILSISIDGGVWQNLTMTMQEPGIWNTSLSEPDGGHEATYKVYAMDSLGNWAVSEEHSFTVEQLPDYSLLYTVLGIIVVAVLFAAVTKLRN